MHTIQLSMTLKIMYTVKKLGGKMKITQIRNATLKIEFGGINFLIDPWLNKSLPEKTAKRARA